LIRNVKYENAARPEKESLRVMQTDPITTMVTGEQRILVDLTRIGDRSLDAEETTRIVHAFVNAIRHYEAERIRSKTSGTLHPQKSFGIYVNGHQDALRTQLGELGLSEYVLMLPKMPHYPVPRIERREGLKTAA